ncbi:hypothetical protein RclHR1_31400001 [Rhizophagus clarus]|uniref:Uncharacterized protein n=1 Tax=Rhizophagus clarus TaxID=94130 RepID=A0A2Z6R7D5_9GLOM|nr:hypothetical protein RclHR1_31400001 [Rhizophagus clarus]
MGIGSDYIPNIDKIGDYLIYSGAKDFQFEISYQKALSSLFICDIDKNHYHWRDWQISNYHLFELLKEQSEFSSQILISVNKTYENNKTLVKHCYCRGCNKSNQTTFKIVVGKMDLIQSKEFVKINVVYLPNKRKCKHLDGKMFGQCHGYARQVLAKSKDFGSPRDMRKKILLNIKNEVCYTGNQQEPIQTQPLSLIIFNEAGIFYYHYNVSNNPEIFLDYTEQLVKPVPYYLTPVNNSNNKRILNALFTMPSSNNSSDASPVDVFELIMNNLSLKNLQNYLHVFRQKELQLFGSNSVPFLINTDCAQNLLIVILKEYNNENVDQYIDRMMNSIINNEFDRSKVIVDIPDLCLDYLDLNNLEENMNNNSMQISHLLNLEKSHSWTYDLNNNVLLKIIQNNDNNYKILISQLDLTVSAQLTQSKSIKNPFYSLNLVKYLDKVWWKAIVLWSNLVPAIKNRTRHTTATVEVKNNIVKNLDIGKKNLPIDQYIYAKTQTLKSTQNLISETLLRKKR